MGPGPLCLGRATRPPSATIISTRIRFRRAQLFCCPFWTARSASAVSYATFGLRLRRAQDGHSHRPPRCSSQPVAIASATLLESEPQSNRVVGISLRCAGLSHSNSNAFRSLLLCRTFNPISRLSHQIATLARGSNRDGSLRLLVQMGDVKKSFCD